MKKLILLIFTLPLFLLSCTTGVKIDYLAPSEIDMSSYRTVAIASCVPYTKTKNPGLIIRNLDVFSDVDYVYQSGYNGKRFAKKSSEYVTDLFETTLKGTGYFTVIGHEVTDSIISASKKGYDIKPFIQSYNIDAIIIPKISYAEIDEAIESDEYTTRVKNASGEYVETIAYRYILHQSVSITVSYTIIDTATMEVYSTKKLQGYRKEQSDTNHFSNVGKDPLQIAKKIIYSFDEDLIVDLVPHRMVAEFNLVKNKPKLDEAKAVYKIVNKNPAFAELEFKRLYDTYGHIPSGVNAAILKAKNMDYDGAIELLGNIYSASGDRNAYSLLESVKCMKTQTTLATKQFERVGNKTDRNIFQTIMDE